MINAITTARGQLSRKGSVVPTNDIEAEMAQAPERVANGKPQAYILWRTPQPNA
jgi:hypothetical protein